MKAIKALKKLKKKQKQAAKSSSLNKLEKLKGHASLATPNSKGHHSPLKKEIKQVANQALISAGRELVVPLNPVLSWFNEGVAANFDHYSPSLRRESRERKFKVKSVTDLPLKSPPCKRCPALSHGACKCAIKRFGKAG